MLYRFYRHDLCIYGGGSKGNGRFLSGDLAIYGMIIFQPSCFCSCAATVIFSVVAIVCGELRERF